MKSGRFTSNFSRASKRKIALRETYCTAGFRRSLCRLWVSRLASGRSRRSWYVRYASNNDPIGASQRSVAMCQKRTKCTQQKPHSITSSAIC